MQSRVTKLYVQYKFKKAQISPQKSSILLCIIAISWQKLHYIFFTNFTLIKKVGCYISLDGLSLSS